MPNCFVIMPITTPDSRLQAYAGDSRHFGHVLDHLFIPAIKAAEFVPIPPAAKGAELIHGGIIKNLESADLVLCDMSILNPNVFFELGIRTALNKPVCLVRDDLTEVVPFDTNIINNHKYKGELAPWTLEGEIQALTSHIKASIETAPDSNALWSYFSMSLHAEPSEEKTGVEGKVDFLNMQIEGLRRQLDPLVEQDLLAQKSAKERHAELVYQALSRMIDTFTQTYSANIAGSEIKFRVPEMPPPIVVRDMVRFARSEGYSLSFEAKEKTKKAQGKDPPDED